MHTKVNYICFYGALFHHVLTAPVENDNSTVLEKRQYPYSQYVPQQWPFADGPTLAEYSQINIQQCQQVCEQYGPNCVGFTFKYMNPQIPGDATTCYVKAAPVVWRGDGLCGPNNQLCVGYAKFEYIPIPGDFQQVSPPMIDAAVLPGYPKYNLPFEQCIAECRYNTQCNAVTYKQRGYDRPNDESFCLLSSEFNRWRSDGICGINDVFCKGFRKNNAAYPGSGGPGSGGGPGYPGQCPAIVPGFQMQPYPWYEAPTLAGYPKYNYPCDRCVQECQAYGSACFAVTYKERDPTNPNDYSSCALAAAPPTLWRGDGLCGPDNFQQCHGWLRV